MSRLNNYHFAELMNIPSRGPSYCMMENALATASYHTIIYVPLWNQHVHVHVLDQWQWQSP